MSRKDYIDKSMEATHCAICGCEFNRDDPPSNNKNNKQWEEFVVLYYRKEHYEP